MTAEAKMTPMMAQYHEIKAQYPDAFLFYRLGDFYEMFFDDALKAAKILEITLTSRNKKADNPIPMCGVPYHSAKDYIKRLIESGNKVAICEQVEDPKLTKGMVKREVVQVITPGTLIEEEALEVRENNYLVALRQEGQTFYLAAIDVSTGEIKVTQTPRQAQLFSELYALKPSEIVVDSSLDAEIKDQIKQQLAIYLSSFDLTDQTEVGTQWVLDQASPQEASLLNLLLAYLYSIQKQALGHLQPVVRYAFADYLQMNHFAKSQLELTKSLRTGRKKGSLLWLIDHTKTAMGGRMLHQWLEKPLIDEGILRQRHQQVAQLMSAYFERLDLIAAFETVYDLERLVTRISLGTANARDVDHLRQSLGQIPHINRILEGLNASQNQVLFEGLPDFQELYQLIDTVLADEPPISVTEGNIIRPGYHEELDQYRDALANGHQWLAELQQRERDRTGLKTLKVGYNKVFGYYIEMSRLQSANFDDPRYIRKQTLSNAERFITEELKQLETTILGAQEKATQLEYQLFTELRQAIAAYTGQLQTLASQIASLDVLANFASLSEREDYCQPEMVAEAKHFQLEASRHPALEKLIGKAAFVPNDFVLLPDQPLLLLTGPNMSGKSTYMRQIAFCVILNQIGCFVPAKSAKLPIVDKIFTRIGASDDISSGQSTFMVEMMETNVALREATPRSLLLFDEIGRGTATFDGMALAEAILYYLAQEVQAATVFSTHYHELTDLSTKLPVLRNIHVGATEQNGQVVFLHKILEGAADKSYGIHVAKLAGLPQSLLVQSQEVLQELESNSQWLRRQEPESDGQLSLFDLPATKPSPKVLREDQERVLKQLADLDINQLTPLQALEGLAAMQDQLK